MKITIQRYNANRKPEPVEVDAYRCGDHLAVHKDASNIRWIVTHIASGNSVTAEKVFTKRSQAMRYGLEMQAHLDFSRLKPGANMSWDVREAFGQDNIRKAIAASFEKAYAA